MAQDREPHTTQYQHLSDAVLKLALALLLVPIVFLQLVQQLSASVQVEAMKGHVALSTMTKVGLYGSLVFSLVLSLFLKTLVALRDEGRVGSWSSSVIVALACGSVLCVTIGLVLLVHVFVKFPIWVHGPFILGKSSFG